MNERGQRPIDAVNAQSRLSALVQGSDDGIITTTLDGTITGWSPGTEVLYGYRAERAIGQHISFIYPESERPLITHILEKIIRGEQSGAIEGVRQREDHSLITVEVRISPIFDDAGVVIGTSSIVRDIGGRLRREQELRESREFLERTEAIGHIGSWRSHVGLESILTWTNETYRIFDIDPSTTVRNFDFYNLIHPDDRQLLVETLINARRDGTRAELEVRFVRPDGSLRWIYIAADTQFDEAGLAVGQTGVVQDITERKESEILLAYDALHDQLTGLPNRNLFLDRTARALARAQRDASKIAVLYLDLDRFKLVNDAQGNEYGDALLQSVADRLRTTIRATDSVARFGADEFGLVCENIKSAADAAERAARILSAIETPFSLSGSKILITASIGIALGSHDTSPESLLRDADLAMHRAKEQGRNRLELYDFELRRQVHQRFDLEASLRHALDSNELFLEFQPIASLTENRFIGAEALVRWKNPERGVVAPNDFIPIAEEIGLIVPIGTWVLEAACRQLRAWQHDTSGTWNWYVSVNVAPAQLRASDFCDGVRQTLEKTGLEAASLRIELTESALIDVETVTKVLSQLRELGVRISIDDFGTGYSSLSYLKRLPIDELKIDRSFIDELVGDESNQAIVSAILAIGRSLGLAVIAEGVETETQLTMLRRLGCESIQGFFFAQALAPEVCATFLQRAPDALVVSPINTWV